jgi:hypothetical protein
VTFLNVVGPSGAVVPYSRFQEYQELRRRIAEEQTARDCTLTLEAEVVPEPIDRPSPQPLIGS